MNLLSLPFDALFTGVSYVIAAVFWTWLLWVFYVAVMHLQEARDAGNLTGPSRVLAVPVLVVGYTLDFAVNATVFSVLLFEPPRELTVTARLKRHKHGEGWRGRVARWMAEHILDPFDPDGRHI